MEWGVLNFGLKIAQSLFGLFRKADGDKIEPDVDWHFNARRRHYDFSIRIRNPLEQRIRLQLLKLVSPSGGALRRDHSPPLIIIGDDEFGDRDNYDRATLVMEIGIEIAPRGESEVNFAFVPPLDWKAGEFRSNLELSIMRSSEERRVISIRRYLREYS